MSEVSHNYAVTFMRKAKGHSRGSIIFLGDKYRFSDCVLRLAEAEASSMQVSRISGLDALDLNPGGRYYIFFDEDIAEELLADPHKWITRYPGASWILAYRDDAFARNMLALRRREQVYASIGLLPMNLSIDQWTPTFRLVLSGGCFVPSDLLQQGAVPEDADAPRTDHLQELLTPRECEVLGLVAEGKRNKTIAYELGLSEHTVKLHLHHVITKIIVTNRTQAAQWFLKHQFGTSQ